MIARKGSPSSPDRMVRRGSFAVAAIVVVAALGGWSCEESGRPRATPIAIGATAEGSLDRDDWTDVFADRSFTDLYEVRLASGQTVTFEASSTEFDTYISLLRGPGDQLVDNDDAAPGTTDSRIVYTSATDATYFLAVTSFRAGATGRYRLRIAEGATEPPAPAPAALEPDRSKTAPSLAQP